MKSLNFFLRASKWHIFAPITTKLVYFTTGININTNTDHITYMQNICSLVRQLIQNPKNFKALSNLDAMLDKTHYLDSATSVYVIEGLCMIKKLQRAKDVLLNMKKNVKVCEYFLYSLVFDCLVKDGKIDEVEMFWSEVCEFERKIDCSDYVVYLSKFGEVGDVKRISERVLMCGKVLREQSYMALIGGLCKNNEGLLAKKVLEEMNDKGFKADDFTYVAMFQCYCRNGELDEADWILRRLVRRKFKMDIFIYGSFLYGLCKTGKYREANKLFRKLIKKDCVKASEVELLKQGRRAILQLDCEGVVPEVMAYETYFRSLCRVGRLDEAEILLKRMMKRRTMPEICVYGSFIKALFLAGRDEDAIKFFNVERKKGLVCVDEIERFIVMGLCENGKVDDAIRIFNDIITRDGIVAGTSICNGLLNSFWKEQRVAEAESFFERMRDIGPPDVQAYLIMVHGFCNRGNIASALGIFEEMLEYNIPVNGTFYEIIIRGLCVCRRNREAHKFLNEMIENKHLVSYGKWKSLIYPFRNGDKLSFQ